MSSKPKRETSKYVNPGYKAFFVLIGLLTSFLSQSILPVHAETNWDILLIPSKKEYFAHPGDQIRGTVTVRNDGDAALVNITAFAKNFTANDQETGDPKILDTVDAGFPTELASWMTFAQDPVTVPPEDSIEIEYLINVPPDAEPGGHYAVLYVRQMQPGEGQTAMGILGQVGSLILVTVSGDVRVEGSLVEFYPGKKLYEYLPVDLYLRLQNSGNVHFRPVGTIFINDWTDHQVGTVEVNEGGGVILPQSIRRYQSFWKEAFLTEEYKLDANGNYIKDEEGQKTKKLTINWKKWNLFRIGKYTAQAVVVFDDQNGDEQQIIATTSFWVIPWKIILAVIIGILALTWGLRKANKWYSRRLIERYEQRQRGEVEKRLQEHKQWHERKEKREEKKTRLREHIRLSQRVQDWFEEKLKGKENGTNGNGKKNNGKEESKEKTSLRWKQHE